MNTAWQQRNCPSSTWRVEELTAWRGFSLEWASDARLLFANGHRVYETDGWCGKPVNTGTFSEPWWRRTAARYRPAQRLLRAMFYNLLPLTEGALFATFGRSVGLIGEGTFRKVRGLRRPCRVLRGGCAVAATGDVFFGEYFGNGDRDAVHVYRYKTASGHVEVVYTFDPGSIRHVHGIYRDPYTDDLWCLTGDRPSECRMLVTSDRFATRDVVGAGDESWRAVSVQFTSDAVYYGTDAQFVQNRLFRIDRASGRRDVLGPINGPVYYSCQSGGEMFFAVSAELCPSQTDRCATLWHVSGSGRSERVVSFEKDRFHKTYFMPGTLHFPAGPGAAGAIHFHAVGLRGADNRLFAVRRAA